MNLVAGQPYRSSKHGRVTFVGPGKNGCIVQHDGGQIFEVAARDLLPWLGDVWLVLDLQTNKVVGVLRSADAASQRAADPAVAVLPYRQM